MGTSFVSALTGAMFLMGTLPSAAADLKIGSRDDIVKSSSLLAQSLMTFYDGDKFGKTPGILPGPPTYDTGDYYWINAASFWATYLDYQHLTGDDMFQASVIKGMAFQTGPNYNYMPPNQTAVLGNDDQCFWGSAAMLAAEYNISNAGGELPAWIEIAKNVWETMASPDRQDDKCGGGLRWQIPPSNAGYDYKQTTANGCLINLGARLARFTGNATYAEHSEKTWDWLTGIGFIDNETWAVYDGAKVDSDCTAINKVQWSSNAAILIEGAAFMYNFTKGSDVWRKRTEELTDATLKFFFHDGVAYESSCESEEGRCSVDALFMKGQLHRWLSVATQVAPFLSDKVLPVLKTSAQAAAKQCKTGANDVEVCGFYWSEGTFFDPKTADNTTGIGEGLSVLSAISSLLIIDVKAPLVGSATGTSSGDPNGPGGSGSGGSPTTGGTSSPTKSPSAAGRFVVDMKTSLLIGFLTSFVWAL